MRSLIIAFLLSILEASGSQSRLSSKKLHGAMIHATAVHGLDANFVSEPSASNTPCIAAATMFLILNPGVAFRPSVGFVNAHSSLRFGTRRSLVSLKAKAKAKAAPSVSAQKAAVVVAGCSLAVPQGTTFATVFPTLLLGLNKSRVGFQPLVEATLGAGLVTAFEKVIGLDTGSQPAALLGLCFACGWTWVMADPEPEEMSEDEKLLRAEKKQLLSERKSWDSRFSWKLRKRKPQLAKEVTPERSVWAEAARGGLGKPSASSRRERRGVAPEDPARRDRPAPIGLPPRQTLGRPGGLEKHLAKRQQQLGGPPLQSSIDGGTSADARTGFDAAA